jgi:hypothetical protein
MRKLFFNVVAASLVLVPLVTRAQAPAEPPQAGAAAQSSAGSDAAVVTVVNSTCTACHGLDRVRAKTADAATWNATVARMQKQGAPLSDREVSRIAEYLTRAAATLPDPSAAPPTEGTGVITADNLEVLAAQDVESTMQHITVALGVRCIDCHDMNNMAGDTKPLKLKAREMLGLTRDINDWFGDGETHVTCWSCHRGSIKPETSGSTNQGLR